MRPLGPRNWPEKKAGCSWRAWRELNQRRCDLIEKECRRGRLPGNEAALLKLLQERVGKILDRVCPLPK